MNNNQVLKPKFSFSFKKAYRKVLKSGRYKAEDFEAVYKLLVNRQPLPDFYQDHVLV